MSEIIMCVDENGMEIGSGEKIEVHKKGYLHSAFSIFIFNNNKELLLQRRQLDKYHSPGLWANTCCSHQRRGEVVEEAANRRLNEEMGLKSELREIFSFKYKVEFDNGIIENEFDHVFIGKFKGTININKEEVFEYKWISIEDLEKDIEKSPNNYVYWLKYILKNYNLQKYIK